MTNTDTGTSLNQEEQVNLLTQANSDNGTIKLNSDQEDAFKMVVDFILDPSKTAMVITGNPGTGKSVMIDHIYRSFEQLKNLQKLFGMVPLSDIHLTATTQQAASVVSSVTGEHTRTIQSLLGLRVHTDYSGRRPVTRLVPTKNTLPIENALVIIDEMSYEGTVLKGFVTSLLKKSKVIHVGDYDQILGVGESVPAIQKEKYPTAVLRTIERRRDMNGNVHPITQLSEDLTKVINGGAWSPTKPDGHHLYLCADRDEFNQLIMNEFSRPNWKATDSRIICFRNDVVKNYNATVQNFRGNADVYNIGDILTSNKLTTIPGGVKIQNNAQVFVKDIEPSTFKQGPYIVRGWMVTTDYGRGFMPAYSDEVKTMRNYAHNILDTSLKYTIEEQWLDLRHAYAMTSDKSQGSTFNMVFVDLDDFRGITQKSALVRRLNVAITRARDKVIFCGKLAI